MISWLIKILGGGLLDRALDSVDKHIESTTDRERIKGELISENLRTRGDFMRSGGFWLMIPFVIPLAFWYAAVCVYSVFWCARCAYPQTWTIAALPDPLNEWAGLIVMSIFGVVGLMSFKRK